VTDPDEMSDGELAELAKEVADRLERRGVVAGAGGIAAGGALGWLASGEARAGSQSTGQIGTEANPIDIEAEDLNGADLLAASQGQAPVADGNGGLQMDSAGEPNVPDWTEDANSPGSATNVGSFTFTLAGTFDVVRCYLKISEVAGSVQVLNMQVNGDTGANYRYRTTRGTLTTGDTNWDTIGFLRSNNTNRFIVDLEGRWGNRIEMGNCITGESNVILGASNAAVSSPLDSITVFGNAGNITVDSMEVYGRSI